MQDMLTGVTMSKLWKQVHPVDHMETHGPALYNRLLL